MEKSNKKIEGGKKTVTKLIGISRKIFSEQGYAHASTENIVRLAGVTRGALYHHFSGKKDLFLAVFEDALTDVVNRIKKTFARPGPLWERFLKANYTFLRVCKEPEIQQIVFIDAPSVLGWDVWLQIDEKHTMKLLKDILSRLVEEKIIQPLPVDALAHSISGAANESALWIAQSNDPDQALEEANRIMGTLLNALLMK